MMNRILVAVDDSRPSLTAAALAIELAQTRPTELNFVTATEPGTDAGSLLSHVAALAAAAGITASVTTADGGQPFEALLTTAHKWGADVIVMGRSDIRRPGAPYVGSQTEHLLEFTDIPVLVVPEHRPDPTTRGGQPTDR